MMTLTALTTAESVGTVTRIYIVKTVTTVTTTASVGTLPVLTTVKL